MPGPGRGRRWSASRAVALNHLDLWQRRGIERVQHPASRTSPARTSPARWSTHLASEVRRRDSRVMLQPGLSCGRCARCLEGRDNECPRYDVLGIPERRRLRGARARAGPEPHPIPDAIGFVEAAAFPLTFLTAWHMLVTRAALQSGETVLVVGAGSGVGQAAIQIARLHGARVVATAGRAEKLEPRARSWAPSKP